MYSVDINFLNDRQERQSEIVKAPTPGAAGDRKPLYIGLGVLVAALAGVGGFWGFLKYQERSLLAQQAELDAQLVVLQRELAQVETIRQQTAAVREESRALAAVFEKIRPWSAIVADVQNRIPTKAQIDTIQQTEGEAVLPTDGSEPVPPPAGGISVQGTACSFDDVNDFVLTLQNSPFLESESVELKGSSLGEAVLGRCPGEASRDEPLRLVDYTIGGNIESVPVQELERLLAELENQQASVGLAARIEALLETGAIE
ncbi:MAG: pilus assembly protein PilN [Leptolyngbya sp. SIO4C1]|nr:pilus assembly protein PilN [Leptolyngbya sp. SIO4C1]